MHDFKIWDSHVHLFPPEVYENWEKYAARDNWFALLTKKPENGKGTEEDVYKRQLSPRKRFLNILF